MNIEGMTLRAMEQLMEIGGATRTIDIAGIPTRAIVSEVTTMLNVMRGKTDNKKRWNIAVLRAKLTNPAALKIGAAVTIEGKAGTVEEDDFVEDCGLVTCFVS